MNFQDLYKKIKQLDEQEVPMTEPAPAATDAPPPEASAAPAPEAPTGDVPVEECGGDMMPHAPSMPKQSDSVTMNVSMNGSGKGGIRDLLNVLKDIEGGVSADDDKALFGKATSVDMNDEPIMGDNFANSVEGGSDTEVYGIDAVTGTGDDLHSKGGEAEKVNGGGNPFNVDESLVSRLSAMYEEIKESKKESEPEGTYSKKRFETDGQRVARLAKEKRQAEKKEAESK